MITVYSGARDPEALSVTITRGRTDLDMTSVEKVEFKLRSQDGTVTKTWEATTVSASAAQLTATYVFDSSGSDVDTAMIFRVMPHLTLANSGGVRRCVPFNLQVLE